MLTDILSRTVSELSQLIIQILDTLSFWAPPLWVKVRDNVRCSSWAHWKVRSRLPISVNWTFFTRCYDWGATGENRSKISVSKADGSLWAKFSRRWGRHPPIIFARMFRPMNAIQLCRWQFWINEQFNWYKNQLVHKGLQHLHVSKQFSHKETL